MLCQIGRNLLVSVLLLLSVLGARPVSGQPVDSERPIDAVPSELSGDHLTLFVYPATVPMDYRSPRALLWSMARNELGGILSFRRKIRFPDERGRELSMKIPYRSIIGHTIVCVTCTLPDGQGFSHWSSMSSYDYSGQALHMFLYEKRGLAMLFHDFPDGRMLRGAENILRLVNYHGGRARRGMDAGKRNSPRYISFAMDPQECVAARDMILFFESMQHAATAPDGTVDPTRSEDLLYFSSVLDPFESYSRRLATGKGKVGGGCAPFGVSLLKATGHFDPAWDSLWARPFHVSENLLGGFETKVSPFSVLFGKKGRRWVHQGYPVRSVALYDPGLIWDFIGSQRSAESTASETGTSGLDGESILSTNSLPGFHLGPQVELHSPELELVPGKKTRMAGKSRVIISGIRQGGQRGQETIRKP